MRQSQDTYKKKRRVLQNADTSIFYLNLVVHITTTVFQTVNLNSKSIHNITSEDVYIYIYIYTEWAFTYVPRRMSKISKNSYQLHHVRLSVRMEQLNSHWTDFDET